MDIKDFTPGRKFKHVYRGSEWTIQSVNPQEDLISASHNETGQIVGISISHFDRYYSFISDQLPMGDMQDFLETTGLDIKPAKCECGADTLGSGKHSYYCAKAKESLA